jgi:hypothetical protein
MTRLAEGVRFSGQIVMWIAAWFHAPWGIVGGIAIVLFGWTYSLPRWLQRAPENSELAPS